MTVSTSDQKAMQPVQKNNWIGKEETKVEFAFKAKPSFQKRFDLARTVYSLSKGKQVDSGEFVEFLLSKFQLND